MAMLANACITCFQHPGDDALRISNENTREIRDALRKHFWFTDIDLARAVICQFCWNQVQNFHQFYVSVEGMHQNRPASVMIKSEPMAEEDPLEGSLPVQPNVKFEIRYMPDGTSVPIKAEVDTDDSSELASDTTTKIDGRVSDEVQVISGVETKNWKCYVCKDILKTAQLLSEHIKDVHGESPRYQCDICSKPFRLRWCMLKHQKTHQDCKCEYCGEIQKSRSLLYNHIRLSHKAEQPQYHIRRKIPEDELKVQCKICDLWLPNMDNWKIHVAEHM